MLVEFLYHQPNTKMYHKYRNLDKLFVFVDTINDKFFNIKMETYDYLMAIGKSKFVFVYSDSLRREKVENCLPIEQCAFPIIAWNSHYIEQNYNFIHSGQFIRALFESDKINIVIDDLILDKFMIDNLSKADVCLDIIIQPMEYGMGERIKTTKNGILKIGRSYPTPQSKLIWKLSVNKFIYKVAVKFEFVV